MDVLWLLWKKCRSNSKRPRTFSASTKIPVDSITNSTPISSKIPLLVLSDYILLRAYRPSFHGKAIGPSRLAWMHLILFPFTMSSSAPPIFTSCLNFPCTESYLECQSFMLKPQQSVQLLTMANMRLYKPGYNLNMLGKYGSWSS